MGFGAQNEYMIFPIIDLVRKEVRNQLDIGAINMGGGGAAGSTGNVYIDNSDKSKSIVYDSSLLTALESNDYTLDLLKLDIANPRMLTGANIVFSESLTAKLSLIRNGKKLSKVTTAVIRREPKSKEISNPFGMGGEDFFEYVRNKRKWNHYYTITQDLTKSKEIKTAATDRLLYLENRNIELRNVYNIPKDRDLAYTDLIKYLPNPLAMDVQDFVTYCLNKWIVTNKDTDSNITQDMYTQATEGNSALRTSYLIDEEVYTYAELYPYLPNPLGMQNSDFVLYVGNLTAINELHDSLSNAEDDDARASIEGQIQSYENANIILLGKYFRYTPTILNYSVKLDDYQKWGLAFTEDKVSDFYDNVRDLSWDLSIDGTNQTISMAGATNDYMSSFVIDTFSDPLQQWYYLESMDGVTTFTALTLGEHPFILDASNITGTGMFESVQLKNLTGSTLVCNETALTYGDAQKYLPKPDDIYTEHTLFRIVVTLIYDSGGKFKSIKSETIV